MGENKKTSTEIKDSDDIKEILCKQMELLAEKSKECTGPELHFTSSTILEIGKYLNKQYFPEGSIYKEMK